MEVREEQHEKVICPMYVKLSGRTTEVRDLQSKKVP
jgi:hypothetical protein